MKYLPHLKIEFRAVPYSSEHVLEYRISPNQDLTYEDEISIFGLFKIKVKRKFKTNWHQPVIITYWPGSERYSKKSGELYLPFFIREKKDLQRFKTSFNTIGEFFDFMYREEAKAEAKWQIERTEYLKNCGTWE